MFPRTKCIALPYYFFRSDVENLEIKVFIVNINDQLADQFTKGSQDKSEIARYNLMGWLRVYYT